MRAITDHAAEAIFLVDAEGRTIFANSSAERLFGWKAEEFLGRSLHDRIHGEYPDGRPFPMSECPLGEVLRSGRTFHHHEDVFHRKDRSLVPVSCSYAPILRDGTVVGAVVIVHDITELKRTEAELRETAERLGLALAAAKLGTWSWDAATNLVTLSDRAAAIFGVPPGPHLTWTQMQALLHEQDRERTRLAAERAIGEQSDYDVEYRVNRPAGGTCWVSAKGRAHYDPQGRARGMLGVLQDVTERKQAEEAHRHLAAIVESSDDAIVGKTLDGVVTSWNKGAERIFGYAAEEIIGRPLSVLVPPDLSEELPRLLDRIRRGERVEHYQTKRRRKDGRLIDVSLTVSPIRDAAGRVVGASKIARDITDLRRAEEALREANRRKDEFLAMLAHELRNPLAAISTGIQLLRQADVEDAQHEWSKQVIERQVKHLSRLIHDLLDVSRITRGKIRLKTQMLDAAPILAQAIEAVRPLIEERKHRLNVSYVPGALLVEADPTRLEQIVVNLLTNAAKFTDPGGCIGLTAEGDGATVAITVRDNGIGIPPEELAGMFELFVQGERSLARSEGGLGIGLTLVKTLTELHGGTVTATSEGPGRGCEFTVRLPAARKPPEDAPPPRHAERRPGRPGRRILVVDDNVDSARATARLLKLQGHEVRTAYDGREAIEGARTQRPDYVLLDIGMPGMDGYEVARRLRQEGMTDTVIVAVTGYGEEQARRRSREAGIDHHLVKPVEFDSLLAVLAGAGRAI